jgi:hypothetical protein
MAPLVGDDEGNDDDFSADLGAFDKDNDDDADEDVCGGEKSTPGSGE